MRTQITTFLIVNLAWGAMALDKVSLDQKAQKLLARFETVQANPDKRVPPEVLRHAQGIILLDRTKAGFGFAYQGGGGMALVKDKQGQWGPLAFMRSDETSFGFQAGGQETFLVILLMDQASARTLMAGPAREFGGEARATAGDRSAGVEGKVEEIKRSVLVYGEREGFFGGAAVKGGALAPDDNANRVYYGAPVTMQQLLFEKEFEPTRAAIALARRIDQYAATGK